MVIHREDIITHTKCSFAFVLAVDLKLGCVFDSKEEELTSYVLAEFIIFKTSKPLTAALAAEELQKGLGLSRDRYSKNSYVFLSHKAPIVFSQEMDSLREYNTKGP
ncbi:hypothetical protein L484_027985 [Morus notabilis]|uniref:Uncharacterized protein n=1 Tax=Morus notabilis TaxID=981085 RepID=W9S7U7_9ROSA|nr:hypothetical protein L484_027985 [Morus notabilis]